MGNRWASENFTVLLLGYWLIFFFYIFPHAVFPDDLFQTSPKAGCSVSGSRCNKLHYEAVLISTQPNILLHVVGRNRKCRWKEGYVHVPNCKTFLVTEVARKHVRRRARF